jgi:MFS family permease
MLGLGLFAQAASAALLQGLPALGPELIERYRLSLGGLGLVLAANAGGMVLTLLAWGLLADRVGERPVIAAGMAVGAVGLLVALAGSGRGVLMAGLLLSGVGSSSVNAASGRVVLNWFPPTERGLAMGMRQAGVPLGGAVGAAALPAVALLGGVNAALSCMVAVFLLAAVSAALWLRDAPDQDRTQVEGVAGGGQQPASAPAPPAPSPLRDRRVWRLAAVSGLLVLLQYSIVAYLVVFLHGQRGVSLRFAAGTLVVLQLASAASRVAVGRWSDRRGDRIGPLRLIALLAVAAFLLLGALVRAPLWALVPALLVAGLLGLSWNGLAFTAAGEIAGVARSGTAIGLQNSMVLGGATLTPPLFAAVVGATSWSAAFALLSLPPAVAAALLLSGALKPSGRRSDPVVT